MRQSTELLKNDFFYFTWSSLFPTCVETKDGGWFINLIHDFFSEAYQVLLSKVSRVVPNPVVVLPKASQVVALPLANQVFLLAKASQVFSLPKAYQTASGLLF